MTAIPVPLQPGLQLTMAPQLLVLATNPATAVLVRSVFNNLSLVMPVRLTVYRVVSGDQPGVGNCIINQRTIAPGLAFISPELAQLVLGSGDSVWALADHNAFINSFISGYLQ